MMGIYEIVNLADGKASTYIGSSIHIEERCRHHRSALCRGDHDNVHLQRAWNKYGETAFMFSALEEITQDMLLVMEQEYLDDYFDRGHCYNIAHCAEASARGRVLTEEERRRRSEAATGRKLSEETKRKLSVIATGFKHSEEAKRKVGKASSRPYPAFVNERTGGHIPAGRNLCELCREYGLSRGNMVNVKNGARRSCKGWVLA